MSFQQKKQSINLMKKRSSLFKIIKLLIVGMVPAAFVGLLLPISQLIDESKYILLITGFAYISFSVVMYFSEKILKNRFCYLNLYSFNLTRL